MVSPICKYSQIIININLFNLNGVILTWSHVSGNMLLGVPTEVYCHGTLFLMSGAVNVVIIFVILYVYLPVFYEQQLTSVYEVWYFGPNRKFQFNYYIYITVFRIQIR